MPGWEGGTAPPLPGVGQGVTSATLERVRGWGEGRSQLAAWTRLLSVHPRAGNAKVRQTDEIVLVRHTHRHLALGGGGLTDSCTPRILQERICLVMPMKKRGGSQSSGQGGLSLRGKKGVPQSKKKEGIRGGLQMGISLRIRGPAVWVWGEL